jgi:hypothetical protein
LHAGELEYMDLLLHNTQLFAVKTAMKQEEEEALGECVCVCVYVCVCVEKILLSASTSENHYQNNN